MTKGNATRIGFVGLGLMGTPIALKLIEAGYMVQVWSRTPEKTEPVTAAGASLADSPRALASVSEVVFLCVTNF